MAAQHWLASREAKRHLEQVGMTAAAAAAGESSSCYLGGGGGETKLQYLGGCHIPLQPLERSGPFVLLPCLQRLSCSLKEGAPAALAEGALRPCGCADAGTQCPEVGPNSASRTVESRPWLS
jgi:hypothetical protein